MIGNNNVRKVEYNKKKDTQVLTQFSEFMSIGGSDIFIHQNILLQVIIYLRGHSPSKVLGIDF